MDLSSTNLVLDQGYFIFKSNLVFIFFFKKTFLLMRDTYLYGIVILI